MSQEQIDMYLLWEFFYRTGVHNPKSAVRQRALMPDSLDYNLLRSLNDIIAKSQTYYKTPGACDCESPILGKKLLKLMLQVAETARNHTSILRIKHNQYQIIKNQTRYRILCRKQYILYCTVLLKYSSK